MSSQLPGADRRSTEQVLLEDIKKHQGEKRREKNYFLPCFVLFLGERQKVRTKKKKKKKSPG